MRRAACRVLHRSSVHQIRAAHGRFTSLQRYRNRRRRALKPEELTKDHVSLQLYPGYSSADTQIFSDFANPDATPEPGFVVDFLGCRIRTTSLWTAARGLDGQRLGFPIPADFHAEAIEWIGLLKAVGSAAGQYVALELGAGFGPWSVAGASAARRRGIQDIRLCAVEADPQHFRFLRQHFADNGFDPDGHALFEGAVGVSAGIAWWPIAENSAEAWGSRPIVADPNEGAPSAERTMAVTVLSMVDLLRREPAWDLVHIDVQGDETALCQCSIEELNARVRWLIIGTHSRKIDGDLLDLLYRAGWLLEHEKPAKFVFTPQRSLEEMTTVDGTQVWRNPRF